MARPIVTIAGEYNSYSTGEMLKLVFSNNAFSVANKRQLANNTAPYVFSFFNTTTTPSAFRIAQTKYNWGTGVRSALPSSRSGIPTAPGK